MLIADDILLLLTRDESGAKIGSYVKFGVAGGLLTDLMLSGSVRLTEDGESVRRGRVVGVPEAPWPADPLLAQAVQLVGERADWAPKKLVRTLSRGLVDAVYERLVRAELLTRSDERVLGLFPTNRFVPVDGAYRRDLLGRIDAVLLGGAQPDDRVACLIGLLHASDVLPKVVDRGQGLDRRAAKALAKQVAENYWSVDATRKAVADEQAATVAAIS